MLPQKHPSILASMAEEKKLLMDNVMEKKVLTQCWGWKKGARDSRDSECRDTETHDVETPIVSSSSISSFSFSLFFLFLSRAFLLSLFLSVSISQMCLFLLLILTRNIGNYTAYFRFSYGDYTRIV